MSACIGVDHAETISVSRKSCSVSCGKYSTSIPRRFLFSVVQHSISTSLVRGVGNRCYIQAGTQISPSSRVVRRLCCEDPGTCLYRERCNRYTEPVPVAAQGGELGAPGGCADLLACAKLPLRRRGGEYGVQQAVCACDVVWVLKGSDARRHPLPPRRCRRAPSDPRHQDRFLHAKRRGESEIHGHQGGYDSR